MKPLGLGKSILYFGIPAILMHGIYRGVMSFLDLMGFRLFFTFLLGFGISSLLMLIAALLFYRKEHSGPFSQRFRLQKLDVAGWAWTVGLCVLWGAVPILLTPATEWLQMNWFPPDKLWVRMMTPDPNYFMEVPFAGNPWIFLAVGGFGILNVLGGELFWRGYVFPRQELVFGPRTWIIHAFLWILFRSFLPWELATVIVQGFTLSYVVQRTRNTWPAILAHLCGFITLMFLR